jgi:hypothetical protein
MQGLVSSLHLNSGLPALEFHRPTNHETAVSYRADFQGSRLQPELSQKQHVLTGTLFLELAVGVSLLLSILNRLTHRQTGCTCLSPCEVQDF